MSTGYYCSGSTILPSPYNETTGAICPKGHYCPQRSSAPIPCDPGSYSVRFSTRTIVMWYLFVIFTSLTSYIYFSFNICYSLLINHNLSISLTLPHSPTFSHILSYIISPLFRVDWPTKTLPTACPVLPANTAVLMVATYRMVFVISDGGVLKIWLYPDLQVIYRLVHLTLLHVFYLGQFYVIIFLIVS